jgi:hypothetical protein
MRASNWEDQRSYAERHMTKCFFLLRVEKKMRRLFNTRGESETDPADRSGRNAMGRGPAAQAAPAGPAAAPAGPRKQFVLYLKPNDGPSSQAYRLAVPMLTLIDVVDTRTLKPAEIPPFLKGVPTLLDIAKREAYPGRLCLQILEKLSHRETAVYDADSTMIPQDAYQNSVATQGESGPGPVGQDDGYAPCDFLPSDPTLYQTGRRNKEDVNGIINRMMEERTSDMPAQSTGQPSPAEMSKIMQSMLEA